jgi:hypothetical protein
LRKGEWENGRIKLRVSSFFVSIARASDFAKASSDKDGGHGESERIEVLTINRAARVCISKRALRARERQVNVAGGSEQL